MTNEITTTKQTSVNNVDISNVIKEVIEYTKDKNAVGNIEDIIASVPNTSSLDWKLVSGVLCNSIVEWVADNKGKDVDPMELIQHIQKDIGYLLQRIGLASQSFAISEEGATKCSPFFYVQPHKIQWCDKMSQAPGTSCGSLRSPPGLDSKAPTPIPPFFNKHALNFAGQGLRVTMMY